MAKDDEAQSDADGEGKKGGKLKWIIIGAVVLVLLLGGGAAAFLLLGGDDDSAGAEEEAVEEFEGEPSYYAMDPAFVINLAPSGGVKMLQASVQIFTRDPAMLGHLEQHDPMLRHHLFNLLSAQDGAALKERAAREALAEAVAEEVRTRLGEVGVAKPRVDAVFFTQFVLQ